MPKKEDNTELLSLARKRMELAIAALSESRGFELEDLKFLAGSPDNQWQWPSDVLSTRGTSQGQTISARPCLTINKLPQHVQQVTNDQRQNRPSGKTIPVNDEADNDLAEVYTGIIRHIEYISDADVAYDTACSAQVITGEGYFRLLTDWIDEDSFEQEIRIGRIRNQFSVYMDPTIQDPCGSDAEWCFLTTDILKEEYERDFPDATPLSSLMTNGIGDAGMSGWINESTVRIAEYFYIEHEMVELCLYPSGPCEKGSAIDLEARARGIKPIRTRTSDRKVVKWCKINGFEVLEEQVWPGKWIPVIRVIGNEYEIEGKLHISGLIRNAKDPQRMYNYWSSQEAEMLALAPKAPFVGYGGQFEGYETQWKTANTIPWPYLEVNPDIVDGQGAPLPLPQRSQPVMAQSGLISAKMAASDDIKSVTGQYNSSIGATSNERSGKAILARERQADTGTYHYVDNLARAIRFSTRQIIDLIPKVLDTKRIARIMGVDGEVDQVEIDPEQPEAKKDIIDPDTGAVIKSIFNPGVGKYDVCVITGPSYTTKRQEAAESMSALMQGNPELWAVAGDLLVKSMDWPGAEKLSERLRRTIDPKLLSDQPPPEVLQAQQQIEAMGQQMEAMRKMLENVQTSFEQQELDIKKFDVETKRIAALQESMTEMQMQDTIMGTLHAMMDSGDLAAGKPGGGNPDGLQNNNPGGQPPMQEQPPPQQF
jgi:Cu/Ag efflux protein CusF